MKVHATPLWAPLVAAVLIVIPVTAAEALVDADADAALAALRPTRIGDLGALDALLAKGGLDRATTSLLEAQRAAALHDEAGVREALARYFATGDAHRARIARAHEIAAEVAFVAGRYDDAARHARLLLEQSEGRTPEQLEGTRQLMEIGALLAAVPGQSVERAGDGLPVALTRDKVGLYRATISVGQAREEAVLDTGANLSVASASAAKRMGLRMLDGASSVGNSVGGNVGVKIGIADRLELAGAVLRNVVFIVLDDTALEFPLPGGYRIDAIVGLPVMRAVGRMQFGPGETLRISGSSAKSRDGRNLRLIGSGPYVVTNIAGKEHALFLDTGASGTTLSTVFAAARPELKAKDTGVVKNKAGAGGAERVRYASFERLPLTIGGETVLADEVKLELAEGDDPERPQGVLGTDILSLFESFSIDFRTMTLEVGAPLRAAVGGE